MSCVAEIVSRGISVTASSGHQECYFDIYDGLEGNGGWHGITSLWQAYNLIIVSPSDYPWITDFKFRVRYRDNGVISDWEYSNTITVASYTVSRPIITEIIYDINIGLCAKCEHGQASDGRNIDYTEVSYYVNGSYLGNARQNYGAVASVISNTYLYTGDKVTIIAYTVCGGIESPKSERIFTITNGIPPSKFYEFGNLPREIEVTKISENYYYAPMITTSTYNNFCDFLNRVRKHFSMSNYSFNSPSTNNPSNFLSCINETIQCCNQILNEKGVYDNILTVNSNQPVARQLFLDMQSKINNLI